MNRGSTGWAKAGLLAITALLLVSCGSGSSFNADLSSGNGGGTGITNTFSSPAEMGVGDIMPIEFVDSQQVTVDFSGVASGAQFILAVGSANTSGSGGSIQLTTDIDAEVQAGLSKGMEIEADLAEIDDEGYGAQEMMSAWLRANEAVLAETNVPADSSEGLPFAKAMSFKAAGVGDTETFRVLASLSGSSSYVEVTGRVRCVGTNVIFYVDTGVGSDLLTDAEVQQLCQEFDEVAGAEQDLLGEISDVDGNGKLKVLMTKQINCLGAMGGGIITGYFYAVDLFQQNAQNPLSNEAEIIFTMVPDPNRSITCSGGTRGAQISSEFAMSNLLPAVMPHELQHAISYNQHVFINRGAAEEDWLNEGMSHLVEDLMGYNVENPSRYAMYLASPSTYGVVTQNSPNLMERGAAYLFLRFLYEQAADGPAFLRALENTALRSVSNLEAAFGGSAGFSQFSEFMARWVAALAMTDRGISQDRRYTYQPRTQNAETGNWEGVCLDCDADDNRGTQLTGVHLNQYYGYHNPTIDAATAMFYNITTLPSQMTVVGAQGGGSFGILIRTQ